MNWLALARPVAALALLPFVGLGAPFVVLAAAVVLGVWLVALGPLPANATLGGELAIGVVLGLVAVAPVWAARWAGLIGDRATDTRDASDDDDGSNHTGPLERLYGFLGLAIFGVCGGPGTLAMTLALSYRVAPTPDALVVGPLVGRMLVLGLSLAAPLLAASLVATAARLAIARFGAHSMLVRHRPLALLAVLAICLLSFTTHTEMLVRAITSR